MKYRFLGVMLIVLGAASSVWAQGLNVGGVRIDREGITTGSNTRSVPTNNATTSYADDTEYDADADFVSYGAGDCELNGEPIPCDKMAEGAVKLAKGAGLFLLIPLFFFVIGIVLCIFWIITLIHALTKPIENKAVWVIVIIFVPFGFVLYYFIEMRSFNKKMMNAYKNQNHITSTESEK